MQLSVTHRTDVNRDESATGKHNIAIAEQDPSDRVCNVAKVCSKTSLELSLFDCFLLFLRGKNAKCF